MSLNQSIINNMKKHCFHLYEDKKSIENVIISFCRNLTNYKKENNKNIINQFEKLPKYIQCILSNIVTYIPKEQKNSKVDNLTLFLSDIKESETKEEKPKKRQKRTKTIYEKEGQKRPEVDTLDPLFLFYSSLYNENKDSKMAITWLTEHGCFEDEERNELLKKYNDL